MSDRKFRVGDQVQVCTDATAVWPGETGIVAAIDDSPKELLRAMEWNYLVGVEFDTLNPSRHSLEGRIQQGYGWWYGDNEGVLELLEEATPFPDVDDLL